MSNNTLARLVAQLFNETSNLTPSLSSLLSQQQIEELALKVLTHQAARQLSQTNNDTGLLELTLGSGKNSHTIQPYELEHLSMLCGLESQNDQISQNLLQYTNRTGQMYFSPLDWHRRILREIALYIRSSWPRGANGSSLGIPLTEQARYPQRWQQTLQRILPHMVQSWQEMGQPTELGELWPWLHPEKIIDTILIWQNTEPATSPSMSQQPPAEGMCTKDDIEAIHACIWLQIWQDLEEKSTGSGWNTIQQAMIGKPTSRNNSIWLAIRCAPAGLIATINDNGPVPWQNLPNPQEQNQAINDHRQWACVAWILHRHITGEIVLRNPQSIWQKTREHVTPGIMASLALHASPLHDTSSSWCLIDQEVQREMKLDPLELVKDQFQGIYHGGQHRKYSQARQTTLIRSYPATIHNSVAIFFGHGQADRASAWQARLMRTRLSNACKHQPEAALADLQEAVSVLETIVNIATAENLPTLWRMNREFRRERLRSRSISAETVGRIVQDHPSLNDREPPEVLKACEDAHVQLNHLLKGTRWIHNWTNHLRQTEPNESYLPQLERIEQGNHQLTAQLEEYLK